MNQFTAQINQILTALAGAERIFDLMEAEPEADEGDVTLCNVLEENGTLKEIAEHTGHFAWKLPAEEPGGRTELRKLRGDVKFDNVVFGYMPGKHILNGISLYAKPGQTIAFVGSTGAGKTTSINLINRC